MDSTLIRIIFFIFLVSYVSPPAIADTLQETVKKCESAEKQIRTKNCNVLKALAQQLRDFDRAPSDGQLCDRANAVYDQFSKGYYECSSAGASTCLSICRATQQKIRSKMYSDSATVDDLIVEDSLQSVTKILRFCDQVNRDLQEIHFDDIKVPSCEAKSIQHTDTYIEPRVDKPTRVDSPGFKPIEEVATPPPAKPIQ